MGDRYDRSGRRSPIYDYGRASLPSVPTSSYYGGDIHVTPVPRHETTIAQPRHHNTTTAAATAGHHHRRRNSNSVSNDWRGPNIPVTTTTYTVKTDPVTRSASVREHSRARSSTLDVGARRPPIIVTTRQAKETASSSSTTASHPSRDVPQSPLPGRDRDRGRNAYREDDSYLISQPASSMRSRSHSRYAMDRDSRRASTILTTPTLDDEELRRLRQRTNDERLMPSWNEPRRERPSSYYANPARHSSTAADLGDSGYEYTGPGALLRYDLDNDRHHSSYYRPTVTVGDVERRPYDSRARGGPPPTTRGLDKVNRRVVEDTTPPSFYERPSLRVPPSTTVATIPPPPPPPLPSDRRAGQLEVAPVTVERRPSRNGPRPTSLYQDDYPPRDSRARDYYREEDVGARGPSLRAETEKKRDKDTAIREDYAPSRERRRDSRMEEREPRRHSDEEDDRYDRQYGRDHGSRREEAAYRPDRKSAKDDSVRDDDRDKGKLRDKVATGLSLAAGAIGLGGAIGHGHKDDKDDKGSPRRRGDDEARREEDGERERLKPSRREAEDRPRDDTDGPAGSKEKSRKDRDPEDGDERDRNRRDAEARLNGDSAAAGTARDPNSSSDESKPSRRRRRPASAAAFKPNDAASLQALKEQLRAQEESDDDKEKKKAATSKAPPSPDRHNTPPTSRGEDDARETTTSSSKDDSRGRETSSAAEDNKQVRVVSPPRDKDDKKPIKGILKQPKPQFPEEPNPVREGVAPHKDDKTKGNVPPGARWTKISRKLVNPEALTIGKERFEVRDDFVIVLRVLNKEEIEAYTAATAQLRDMRRQEYEDREKDDERDEEGDERRKPHRSHRRDPRDEEEDERRREREPRPRKHRHEDDGPLRLEYSADDRDRLPIRSHRHRDREREREPVSVRND